MSNHDKATFEPADEDNKIRTLVVGTQYEDRDVAAHNVNVGDRLILKREPDNSHDNHAIAVYSASREKIGYLPSQLAATLTDDIEVYGDYMAPELAPDEDAMEVCCELFEVIVVEKNTFENKGVLIPSLTAELKYRDFGGDGITLVDEHGRFYTGKLYKGKREAKYESGKLRLHPISQIANLGKDSGWRSYWCRISKISHEYETLIGLGEQSVFGQYDALVRNSACSDHIIRGESNFRDWRIQHIKRNSGSRLQLIELKKSLPRKGNWPRFEYSEDAPAAPSLPQDFYGLGEQLEEGLLKASGKGEKAACAFGIPAIIASFYLMVLMSPDVGFVFLVLGALIFGLLILVVKFGSDYESKYLEKNASRITKAKRQIQSYEDAERAILSHYVARKAAHVEWREALVADAAKYSRGLKEYLKGRVAHPWDKQPESFYGLIDERYGEAFMRALPTEVSDKKYSRPAEDDDAIQLFKDALDGVL